MKSVITITAVRSSEDASLAFNDSLNYSYAVDALKERESERVSERVSEWERVKSVLFRARQALKVNKAQWIFQPAKQNEKSTNLASNAEEGGRIRGGVAGCEWEPSCHMNMQWIWMQCQDVVPPPEAGWQHECRVCWRVQGVWAQGVRVCVCYFGLTPKSLSTLGQIEGSHDLIACTVAIEHRRRHGICHQQQQQQSRSVWRINMKRFWARSNTYVAQALHAASAPPLPRSTTPSTTSSAATIQARARALCRLPQPVPGISQHSWWQ